MLRLNELRRSTIGEEVSPSDFFLKADRKEHATVGLHIGVIKRLDAARPPIRAKSTQNRPNTFNHAPPPGMSDGKVKWGLPPACAVLNRQMALSLLAFPSRVVNAGVFVANSPAASF